MRTLLTLASAFLLLSCSSTDSGPQDTDTGGAEATAPTTHDQGEEVAKKSVPSAQQLMGIPARSTATQLSREAVLRARVSAESCEQLLRKIAAKPHMAGTKQGDKHADFLAAKLKSYGFDVAVHEYEVLLPYPLHISVEMTEPFAFSASLKEPSLKGDLDTAQAGIILPFNAYTPDADLAAPLVYANYGRREDFEKLQAMGIAVKGAIVLTRYGHIFRGSKAKIAEEFGAAGLLIYTDPKDDGFSRGDVYPKGPFRPAGGVQRGSILYIFEYAGDPGTPGKASVPGAEQLSYEEMKSLPNIPTTCFSAADAEPFLRSLGGQAVPNDWQGGMPFAYHVGGEKKVQVRLKIEMDYKLRRIRNVVGTLRGQKAPLEEIIIGNHHDAWVFGAIDPGSGTAVALESARVLGEQARNGHPPARTIRFAFWDAEEFGMIGSTEFGEQFAQSLQERCVAYINIDAAVSGPNLRVAGVPSLKAFAASVLAGLPSTTKTSRLAELSDKNGNMRYGSMGSGSDFAVFLEHLGVPCLDFASGGSNGVYHSAYDTYLFMRRQADPGFKNHQAMSQLLATTAFRLAQTEILPFDFAAYGANIRAACDRVENANPRLDLGMIREAANKIEVLGNEINNLRQQLQDRQLAPAFLARLNAGIHRAEQALLLEPGLPNRPWYRHALFAPDPDLGYGAGALPPITDAIRSGDRAQTQKAALTLIGALKAFEQRLMVLRNNLQNVPTK